MDSSICLSFLRCARLGSAAVALLVLSGGCDLLDPGGPSYAGVVVDAETGEPVEGIQLSLQIVRLASSSPVAEDLTDAEGRFWLRDPKDRGTRTALFVNAPGYTGDQPSTFNSLYSGGLVDYDFEDRHDIRVELQRMP